MPEPVHEKPCEVTATQGVVLIDSVGVAATMTPEAALETSERLAAAAIIALGQRSAG